MQHADVRETTQRDQPLDGLGAGLRVVAVERIADREVAVPEDLHRDRRELDQPRIVGLAPPIEGRLVRDLQDRARSSRDCNSANCRSHRRRSFASGTTTCASAKAQRFTRRSRALASATARSIASQYPASRGEKATPRCCQIGAPSMPNMRTICTARAHVDIEPLDELALATAQHVGRSGEIGDPSPRPPVRVVGKPAIDDAQPSGDRSRRRATQPIRPQRLVREAHFLTHTSGSV